jgi:hypothetical protein
MQNGCHTFIAKNQAKLLLTLCSSGSRVADAAILRKAVNYQRSFIFRFPQDKASGA